MDRLESWKEIASYLNRSERTVRSWEEKEGLPIRRLQHDKRGSVFAYTSELDAWRDSRQQMIAAEPAEPPVEAVARNATWRLTPAVITTLLVALVVAIVMIARRPPASPRSPNPEALRAFKQAAFAINAGRVQVQSGVELHQEAIRLDPGFVDAWNGLATARVAQTWFSDRPSLETMMEAKREAQRAQQLDPSRSDSWRVLAAVSHFYDWDHVTAEQQFRKALDLDPGSGAALSWYAEFLANLRRFDEAIEYARRSQEASPRWLETMTVMGNIHAFAGHPDLAIAEYRRALAIEPGFGLAVHFLGRAYLMSGDYRQAVEHLRKSDELMGHLPFTLGDLGYALAAAGARDQAEAILSDMIRRREKSHYPAFPIAAIHMGLGHRDAALEWLERAGSERHMGYYFPSIDPIYEPVQSEPRFKALLQRMNLGLE